jgi:chromosome segregation ATPase
LQNDTQKRLAELEKRLSLYHERLSQLEFDFFHQQAVSYRVLQPNHQPEINTIEQFLASCQELRKQLLDVLVNKQVSNLADLPHNGVEELRNVIGSLNSQLNRLEEQRNSVEEKVQELAAELRLLEHRKTLGVILETVLEYISDEKWISKASSGKVKGNTKHITKKYK